MTDLTRQKRIRRGGAKMVLAFTLIGLALLGYEILRQNNGNRIDHWPDLLAGPLAIAILAGMVTVWAAREQFVLGTRPKLQYWARRVNRSTRLPGDSFWQVTLLNRGSGGLDVDRITFHVQRSAGSPSQFANSVHDLKRTLASHGFTEGQHYWVLNLTSGSGIGKETERLYFECGREIQTLEMLDAVFQYDAALGDRYRKTIHLLPGADASAAVVDVDDDSP